jgi:LysR family transcriptional regulator, glycine cleavage system transcriptional activator
VLLQFVVLQRMKTRMTVRRLCPSITELQAFDAACRHESFTQAAVEMHCTQGAVSRQIASLEATVGVALFERTKQRLVMTDAGRAYLLSIRPALAQLEAATVQLLSHGGRGGALNIAALPTFGAKWLIPRLPAFQRAHPEVTLNFLPHSQGYDFSRPELDASIRFGEGVWPGAHADYIAGRDAIMIVAPDAFVSLPAPSRRKQALTARDLPRVGLLHHVSVPHAWEEWFASVGLVDVNPHVGPRFDQFTLVIQAVAAGIGAAVVPRCLVEDELRSGRVIAPFAQSVQLSQGYYLCTPDNKAQVPSLVTFKDWLLAQAQLPSASNTHEKSA